LLLLEPESLSLRRDFRQDLREEHRGERQQAVGKELAVPRDRR
jgi:hypothetical protein